MRYLWASSVMSENTPPTRVFALGLCVEFVRYDWIQLDIIMSQTESVQTDEGPLSQIYKRVLRT